MSEPREHDRPPRRDPRVPMNAASCATDLAATTPITDLSESGVFVCTSERPPVGTIIELRFRVFVEEPVVFRARGRVVRVADDPVGVGVEFVDLADSARDVLRKILLRHEAQRARPSFAQSFDGLRTHGLVLEPVEPNA